MGDAPNRTVKKTESPSTTDRRDSSEAASDSLRGEALFQRATIGSIKRLDADKPQVVSLGPKEKLGPGDYEVQFTNGRLFDIHIPPGKGKDLPVMMTIPGALSGCLDPRSFITTLGMHKQADRKENPFIVVTPINERHRVSPWSLLPGRTWNLPGALVRDKDVTWHANKVGYDDRDFFAGVMKLVPNISNSTTDYRQWGYSAYSQGSAAVYRLADSDRFKGKIQNVYVISGTMEAGDNELGLRGNKTVAPYDLARQGNCKHVMLIDTAADSMVLPHPERIMSAPQRFLTKALIEPFMGLRSVDHRHQAPQKQEAVQLGLCAANLNEIRRRLGNCDEFTVKAFQVSDCTRPLKSIRDFKIPVNTQADLDAARQQKRDIRWEFIAKSNGKTLTVIELPKAKHAIPGPARSGLQIIPNYDQFDSATAIATDFESKVRNVRR